MWGEETWQVTARVPKARIHQLLVLYECEKKVNGQKMTPTTLIHFLNRWPEIINVEIGEPTQW